jgi:hypothetical protein
LLLASAALQFGLESHAMIYIAMDACLKVQPSWRKFPGRLEGLKESRGKSGLSLPALEIP